MQNQSLATRGEDRKAEVNAMKATMRWLAGLGLVALAMTFSVGFVACGSGSSTAALEDEPQHVEGEDHDDAAIAEHDDGAAHQEGAEAPADTSEDGEANAYLEAAPKDALYLVKMTNFAFTPAELEVNAHEVLEIAIQNVEPVLHDFTIDVIDADVHVSYLGGTGQHAHAEQERDAAVHFALTEPGSGVVHLKIHEPGEYVIYCTVPGHREAGMKGTLIVR